MNEPNYVALAMIFLGPALYFVLTGLLVPSRQLDWCSVGLGLVPGIGLAASGSDAYKLMRSIYVAWKEAWIRRRVSTRAASDDTTAPTVQRVAVNQDSFDAVRRAA